MAKSRISSFVNRMVAGSEKSEDYARATLPSNRWGLFWDIFKSRFFKLVLINLLMVVTLLPLAAVFFFRNVGLSNYGAAAPFSQPFGVGYGAALAMNGYAENITFNVNLIIFLFMPIAMTIASVGLSGGAYVIRNLVWTEGVFVANDFWRGIKQNFKQIFLTLLLYSLIFYITVISASLCDRVASYNVGPTWLFITCKIISYIILAFFTMVVFHMIPLSVTYDLTFWNLFKDSVLMTVAVLPYNIFFMLLACIPVFLCLFGGVAMGIGLVIVIFFGISYLLLVWTDYCHWLYDRFINPKIKGAKVNRGIYEKVKKDNSKTLNQYKENRVYTSSVLTTKPIKPITDEELKVADLPASYGRGDLAKLKESKELIYSDHEQYLKEHGYVETVETPVEDKPTLSPVEEERQKRIERAKKELNRHKKHKKHR